MFWFISIDFGIRIPIYVFIEKSDSLIKFVLEFMYVCVCREINGCRNVTEDFPRRIISDAIFCSYDFHFLAFANC